jgi:DNA-binding response OmpR family regulator
MSPSADQRIVVVEDDATLLVLLMLELEQQGYAVEGFGTGESALIGPAECPELLVLDYQLPGINGLALLARMRERCPAVPALVMSGEHDVIHTAEWRAIRGAAFLSKPFRREHFLDAVARQLGSAARPQGAARGRVPV